MTPMRPLMLSIAACPMTSACRGGDQVAPARARVSMGSTSHGAFGHPRRGLTRASACDDGPSDLARAADDPMVAVPGAVRSRAGVQRSLPSGGPLRADVHAISTRRLSDPHPYAARGRARRAGAVGGSRRITGVLFGRSPSSWVGERAGEAARRARGLLLLRPGRPPARGRLRAARKRQAADGRCA